MKDAQFPTGPIQVPLSFDTDKGSMARADRDDESPGDEALKPG